MAILYWGNRALDPNLQEQLPFKRNSTREKPESTPLPHLMVKLEVFDKTLKIACFGSFSSTPLDLKEFSFKNRGKLQEFSVKANSTGASWTKVSFKQTVLHEAVPTGPGIGRVTGTKVLGISRLKLG